MSGNALKAKNTIFKCNRKDECKKSIRSNKYKQISNYHFSNGKTIYSSFLSRRNRKALSRNIFHNSLEHNFKAEHNADSKCCGTRLTEEIRGLAKVAY